MNSDDCSAFAKACAVNNLMTVEQLYQKYSSCPENQLKLVHHRTEHFLPDLGGDFVTPLHIAVVNNSLEVAKYLIETCDTDLFARRCFKTSMITHADNSGSYWPIASAKSPAMLKLLLPYYRAKGVGSKVETYLIDKAGNDIALLRCLFNECKIDINSSHGLNKLKQGICSASEELIRFIIIECRIKMDHLLHEMLMLACDKYIRSVVQNAVNEAKAADPRMGAIATTNTIITAATGIGQKPVEDSPSNPQTVVTSTPQVDSNPTSTIHAYYVLDVVNTTLGKRNKAAVTSDYDGSCSNCTQKAILACVPCNHLLLCSKCGKSENLRLALSRCPYCGETIQSLNVNKPEEEWILVSHKK